MELVSFFVKKVPSPAEDGKIANLFYSVEALVGLRARALHEPVPSSLETSCPGHPYSFPAPLYDSACSSALARNSCTSLIESTQAWDIF
jgi:hypothetical protein